MGEDRFLPVSICLRDGIPQDINAVFAAFVEP